MPKKARTVKKGLKTASIAASVARDRTAKVVAHTAAGPLDGSRDRKRPPEAALAQMLDAVRRYGGVTVHRDRWPIAEQLASRDMITLGAPRGPGDNWRRAEVVKTVQQLIAGLAPPVAKCTLCGGSGTVKKFPARRQWELHECPDCGGTGTVPAPDFAEAEQRTLAVDPFCEHAPVSFMEMYGGLVYPPHLAKLPGLVLAPPAAGVEPADKFAERLARALCAGEPLSSMVIEILKAVRERDAAIVKAVFDHAERTVPPTQATRLEHVERELFKAMKLSDADKEIVRRALEQAAAS